MVELKLVRGDTRTTRMRFLAGGTPIMLQEGDVGRLMVFDDLDAVVITKTFSVRDQAADGYISICFTPADTVHLAADKHTDSVQYAFEVEIVNGVGDPMTPIRNGRFILLLDRITPDYRQ